MRHLVITLLLLAGCAAPLPPTASMLRLHAAGATSTPALAQPLAQATVVPTQAPPSLPQILDRNQAFTYTWALIRSQTVEPRSQWDTSTYTLVVFPNGDRGVFVALGAWGTATGYQVLYRRRPRGNGPMGRRRV